MVGTVLPIVYGNTHKTGYTRRPSVLLLHVLGCIVGSLATGFLIAVLGRLAQAIVPLLRGQWIVLTIVGMFAILYGCHELALVRLPAPQFRWQVPVKWRSRFSPPVTGLLYGLGLGPGLFTAITSASFYVMLVWVIMQPNLIHAGLVFGVYGLGRVSPLLFMCSRFSQSRELFIFSRSLHHWKPVVPVMSGMVLSVVGPALILAALVT
jgi:hypothetical protein